MLPLPRPARLGVPFVVVVGVALATLSGPTATGARPAPDDDRQRVARLAAVNGIGQDAVRALLRDPTARFTDDGYAYVVDPAAPAAAAEQRPTPARAVAPLKQTFRLHSNPGARRTIYLDFDGHDVRGTAWNSLVGVRAGRHAGWDPAGNGPRFSARELKMIQGVWARVAEDYAPFAVDVTTQQPRADRLERKSRRDKTFGLRVLISGSRQAWDAICDQQCGGVSFVGAFKRVGKTHRRQQPSWVFPDGLRNDTKSVAEATTHEAGHTFGLVHDGGLLTSYYEGHGAWAPIMGAAYFRPITQWSNGAYRYATTRQDDVAIIARSGAPFRADEAGGKPRSAKRGLPRGTAYISRRSDVDVYRIGRCSGKVTVRATNARVSPNLDIRLRLLRNGRPVATADPPSSRASRDRAGGMDATIRHRAGAGTYYVEVDGVGRGDASSAYNDYGSLGAYQLQVRGC